jgi:phage minor structural protein
MIPILFSESATTFTTNGIGRLGEAKDCVCTEERNGGYELELKYPVTGKYFNEIKHSRIIVAKPAQSESNQAFRIYKISKPMIDGTITVNAHHISYQLSNIPVSPFGASSLADTLVKLKSNSMETNPFTLSTDKSSAVSFDVKVPTTCRSCLGGHEGSLLDVYGGEWHFNNYVCELLNARGNDNGVTIRYGKNLIDLDQEENIAQTFTGIVPYWQSSETDECVYASVVNASTASAYPFHRTEIIDFSTNFDTKPTTTQLTSAAQSYISKNNIGYPDVSLSVNFINLADTEEYKDIAALESVSLCDYVTVKFETLGIDQKAQVVRTVYDVLRERYNEVEIGTIHPDLSATIADQGRALSVTLDKAREFTRDATGWLTNGAGYVVANKNADGSWKELLFLDQPTTQAATKVLRINENGIGFASGAAGTFDSWVYYQAWTLDGHLSLGGVNNSYGFLQILNNLGNEIGRWDNQRIRFYDSINETETTIGGNVRGIRVRNRQGQDSDETAIGSGATLLKTDLGNNDVRTAVYSGVGLWIRDASENDVVTMNRNGLRIEDSNNNTEMTPDGFYVNGQKLEIKTSGYTGTVDVETNVEVDFENEDYSADVYTLTFQDGVLVSVD